MAVVEAAGAPGLRDEGIEAEEQADAEQRRRIVNGVAESDGADGVRTEAADHDEIDDGHGHPAEFGKDDGNGEGEEGAEFFAEVRRVPMLLEDLEFGRRRVRIMNRGDLEFGVLNLAFGGHGDGLF